jgi:hypothetical protein
MELMRVLTARNMRKNCGCARERCEEGKEIAVCTTPEAS